jgi:hypothetical protein
VSENCPKHGPYSVFCRECDYEQVHGPEANTQPPTQEVRARLEHLAREVRLAKSYRETSILMRREEVERYLELTALFSPPAGVVEAGELPSLAEIGAVGRVPLISKHRALNVQVVRDTIARLDAAGDREAADVLVWQVWWRHIDENRHQFLIKDAEDRARQALSALEGMGKQGLSSSRGLTSTPQSGREDAPTSTGEADG